MIAGGSSHSQEYVQEMVDLAAKDSRVIMTGFVQGEVLEELYSNAYCFVLPSDIEGMALGLLEAMSYGNCCIASNIPERTIRVDSSSTTISTPPSLDGMRLCPIIAIFIPVFGLEGVCTSS